MHVCAHKKKKVLNFLLYNFKVSTPRLVLRRRANRTRPLQTQHNTKKKVNVGTGESPSLTRLTTVTIRFGQKRHQGLPGIIPGIISFIQPSRSYPTSTKRSTAVHRQREQQQTNKLIKRGRKTEFNALLPHGPFHCKRINCLQRPASRPALLFNPDVVADVSTANKAPFPLVI